MRTNSRKEGQTDLAMMMGEICNFLYITQTVHHHESCIYIYLVCVRNYTM
jgi:hypothetical protein